MRNEKYQIYTEWFAEYFEDSRLEGKSFWNIKQPFLVAAWHLDSRGVAVFISYGLLYTIITTRAVVLYTPCPALALSKVNLISFLPVSHNGSIKCAHAARMELQGAAAAVQAEIGRGMKTRREDEEGGNGRARARRPPWGFMSQKKTTTSFLLFLLSYSSSFWLAHIVRLVYVCALRDIPL